MSNLPIHEALPRLKAALAAHNNAVVEAPPGAGKSTGVPLALLDAPWLGTQRILMLEPRRLAARAVATRMASLLGEPVGQTVGYRTRLDSKVSARTRIEVVTEGILTRRLQNDAELTGVGAVLFDEFHERSLHADLGLALCLEIQETLRDDLKLVVMSATLDGAAVAQILGDAPRITSAGQSFTVTTHYRSNAAVRADMDIAPVVARTIARALATDAGDLLAFLPGQGEIRRTEQLLTQGALDRHVRITPLYGDLTPAMQDAALRPVSPGERKVVLATNLAETSLTIEGIRIVVDSGWVRRSRFDPSAGMNRLETLRVSRASADQRRGRAGRLSAGTCHRLWSESEQASLAAQTPPEILETDLAPLALDLAQWGTSDPSSLRWLDPPPAANFSQARELLRELGALDAQHRVTPHGRELAAFGAHPRLAHLLVQARALGVPRLGSEIAALLGERDPLRSRDGRRDVDLRLRLDALRHSRVPAGMEVDDGARRRIRETAAQYLRQLNVGTADSDLTDAEDLTGVLLAFAYPDRIAQSRGANSGEPARFLLSGGRGAVLKDAQLLNRATYLAVAELDAGDREASIRLAAPVSLAQLERFFASSIRTADRIAWDSRQGAVIASRERWLGALKVEERPLDKPDAGQITQALLTGLRELGIEALPWTSEARALQARISFARRADPDPGIKWPQIEDAALLTTLETWLAPWLDGMSRRDHLARLDLTAVLRNFMDWPQQQRLDRIVPTHLEVPSGSRIPIEYTAAGPALSVRLQEVFGLLETPRIAAGTVLVTLQLLSPARRPVQVTRDLRSFWARGYPEVKKELKGRYPKHYWPDDPLLASPTARAKPKR